MRIFFGQHKNTAVLYPEEIKNIENFYEHYIKNPPVGKKGGVYFTSADDVGYFTPDPNHPKYRIDSRDKKHFRRNNELHKSSWCICIDGDASNENPESCIPIEKPHESLKKHKINHIIYTSPSYEPGKKDKWRLIIPCDLKPPAIKTKHSVYVNKIYEILKSNGCKDLAENPESYRLSQEWFLPVKLSKNASYKSFIYNEGQNFQPEISENEIKKAANVPRGTIEKSEQTEYEILQTIKKGNSPLHDTIVKFIYQNIEDGKTKEFIRATLKTLTEEWDLKDKRLNERHSDIDRLIDSSFLKYKEENQKHWVNDDIGKDPNPEISRAYTDYPDQGGKFEELVRICMHRMLFPNRQLAVTAARTLISTLGARVYTLPNGKGIALTALVTGRSTIGKSNIKKIFQWIINEIEGEIDGEPASEKFLGSQYYTSVRNLIDDILNKYSLLSIRTESGQTDKSMSGDVTRVLAYELEFSTESGLSGYVSSGGQNDKFPAMYHPPVTTIRESVAKIQSDADMMRQSAVSGIAGRRSLVLIDPIKPEKNPDIINHIPPHIKAILKLLFHFAADKNRHNLNYLPPDQWIHVVFEDDKYMEKKEKQWLKKENTAAMDGDDYEATFWGRMYEKLPAYAAKLAIMEDPEKPIITNEQIEIAEKSLLAELNAYRRQEENGDLDDDLSKLVKKIEELFKGDMADHISYYPKSLQAIGKKELKEGVIEWRPISRKLHRFISPLSKGDKDQFYRELYNRLRFVNIGILSKDETIERFGHKRMSLGRL